MILILVLYLAGAVGSEFGWKITNSSPEVGRIVEDFSNNLPSPTPFVQTPVQIGYWDIGPNWAVFDVGDVLYLHVGDPVTPGTSIRPNDIRLTPAPFGPHPVGSKVKGKDNDIGQSLTPFPRGLPQIVFVDEGGIIGQYDLADSVYIKTVSPFDSIRTGDVRLNSSQGDAGTRVLDLDSDNGAACAPLHNGPSFNIWMPFASQRGQVRFYNANGNIYVDPGAPLSTWPSPPIYDEADEVYFDLSAPSAFPRNFGYLTPNAIRLSA